MNEKQLANAIFLSSKTLRRRLSMIIVPYGISYAQHEILLLLFEKKEMTISDIINATISSIGNISCIINNLVKADLISKASSALDKRTRIITIKPRGVKLVEQIEAEYQKALKEMFSIYDQKTVDIATNTLNKIYERDMQ